MNLLNFQRPSRYINGELNSIKKDAEIRVALAFPDVYEVGMSHLGLKILYHIINSRIPYASAERVFSPWSDLCEAMKKDGTPLVSLESKRPLREFDIVGFSLQYELAYTEVLNMLSLAAIPLRSEERLSKKGFPLIIAGGPATLNPLPMSPFIDAFLIGDGEDAIPEMLGVFHEYKASGDGNVQSLLRALSEIEGVYVPSLGLKKKVRRRIVSSLEDAPFPDDPVVPFTAIVHDRVNIEIARGCSMGCRFCQAGMAYRPVRERTPEKILELAERSIKNTGYEDISFTSLSAGDYSCLPELMKAFNRRFREKRVAISLPSLRVATVSKDMLDQIKSVRKTGFTIAPEAGTDRLRAVINKDFTEEIYLSALETLFREGWLNLKLYFMTGLPTETEEDIQAIPSMVLAASRISKKLTGRHVNISVGVSSFIPKPHTPFQWCGQNGIEQLREKNRFLRESFLKRGIKYKGHKEEMSLLEAVFARGDEKLADVIEKAWSRGCRLDAWTESFDFDRWTQAMDEAGISPESYACREYSTQDALPWDDIDTGVRREYLVGEYQKALSGSFTADCRRQCGACGLKCPAQDEKPVREALKESGGQERKEKNSGKDQEVFLRYRIMYSKTAGIRFLSHLELMNSVLRAFRRAELPLRYSSGFHPAPKVSFGPALGVGIAGEKEYLDIEVIPPFDPQAGLEALRRTLPEGIKALRIEALHGREKSLNSFIVRYEYVVRSHAPLPEQNPEEKAAETVILRKDAEIRLSEFVESAEKIDALSCRIMVRDFGEIKPRIDEIVTALFGGSASDFEITRTAVYGLVGAWTEPMSGGKSGQ